MRSRRAPWWTLPAIAALAFAIVALTVWLPWWTKDRPATTATPTPTPYADITPVVLRPGERACEDLVALEPATRAVTVVSAGKQIDGPPLRVTARADGYRSTGEVEGGYGGFAPLQAAIDAPPADLIGEVCVENAGDRRALLQGTTEGRVQTRSVTTVEGEPIEARLSMALSEGTHRSLADRPGQILDRIAAFKPPIVGSWSLALLALLVALGVPALVVVAIARGIAEDDAPR